MRGIVNIYKVVDVELLMNCTILHASTSSSRICTFICTSCDDNLQSVRYNFRVILTPIHTICVLNTLLCITSVGFYIETEQTKPSIHFTSCSYPYIFK